MSARKKPAARRPRHAALTLSQRVERLERDLLFKTSAPAPLAGDRFFKLDELGVKTSGDHTAVLDRKTGLLWTAGLVGSDDGLTWANAKKAVAELTLLGQKDWRLPTIEELLSIVDYSRHNPAVHPAFFKGPHGWTWSSTEYKGASGYAWSVALSYGYSGIGYQSCHFHVRAVRSGQSLGLLA